MARTGGSSMLAGAEYQLLFTATMLAESITEPIIMAILPEVHDANFPGADLPEELILFPQKPAVDDLLVHYTNAPPSYYSLKYRATGNLWDVSQLKTRGVLADFYQQHLQHPTARFVLVSQTPNDRELEDCLERIQGATPVNVHHMLASEKVRKVFRDMEEYLNSTDGPNTSREQILVFLQRIELKMNKEYSLRRELRLRLQPYVANVAGICDVSGPPNFRQGINRKTL